MTAAVEPWFVTAPAPPQWPQGHRGELECQTDPERWFPLSGGRVPRDVRDACMACPVQPGCLAWAVGAARDTGGAGPDGGVWGGFSAEDVKRMARGEVPRGLVVEERPRKGPACDCADGAEHFESGGRLRCRVLQREYSRNARAARRAAESSPVLVVELPVEEAA